MSVFKPDGMLDHKWEYRYDRAGLRTSEISYWPDGSFRSKELRRYDENGNEYKVAVYRSDGSLSAAFARLSSSRLSRARPEMASSFAWTSGGLPLLSRSSIFWYSAVTSPRCWSMYRRAASTSGTVTRSHADVRSSRQPSRS